ncbi:hypothetical protein D3C78_644740 [compost metagenome]
MQPGRRLVEHIDDAKQLRVELGGQAQALQFARRKRRCAALQGEVAEPQVDQRRDALQQLVGDALCGQAFFQRQGVFMLLQVTRCRHCAQHLGQCLQRQARQLADVAAGEGYCQRFTLQTFALAQRAGAGAHELGDAFAHLRTLRVHERVHHIAPGAAEGALVAGFELALERGAGLRRGEAGIHRYGGCLVGVEDPVALLLGQFTPGDVDVVAQGHENVAQVLPLPGHWPGCHRPFTYG